ncbi:MAG: ribonuclease H-like domain-containing protein [Chloroflexota bacterium]
MANSLSSKLKSLGVKVGARDVPSPQPAEKAKRLNRYAVENVLTGRVIANADGACFVVEHDYPPDYTHGHALLHAPLPLQVVARWARDQRIADCARESLVFLDTETTGLAGGTGTLPFMIGVGRFVGDQFRVAQFFMRDPADEAALLTALSEWLDPCETLVTFNGKAFDLPLVSARYTLQRRTLPVAGTPHLDLLPLARRLWRDRLASRALGSLELHILGATRQGQDVPGFLIPLMYFDYLRNGDARPLKGIFYHNAMDILAMAALLGHVAQMMADPVGAAMQHPVDYVSLGKLYEDLGEHETAARAYERGMADNLPLNAFREASQRLSYLHRKQGNYEGTLELWRAASQRGELYAHVALAKYYEHRVRDYVLAERMTLDAISAVSSEKVSAHERKKILTELQHRLDRIRRKQKSASV